MGGAGAAEYVRWGGGVVPLCGFGEDTRGFCGGGEVGGEVVKALECGIDC